MSLMPVSRRSLHWAPSQEGAGAPASMCSYGRAVLRSWETPTLGPWARSGVLGGRWRPDRGVDSVTEVFPPGGSSPAGTGARPRADAPDTSSTHALSPAVPGPDAHGPQEAGG